MKFNQKWVRIMALGLSLPSSILGTAWFAFELEKRGVISKIVAVVIILLVVFNIFFLMIYYAFKNKN